MNLTQLFIILLILSSCSRIRIPYLGKRDHQDYLQGYQRYDQTSLKNHTNNFKKFLSENPGVKFVTLSPSVETYLGGLAKKIKESNEVFFTKNKETTFSVLLSAIPFHLSLPSGEIILSSGLINKYLKHESYLAAILSYELTRIEKSVYRKNIIVPVGYLEVERLLLLNRLTLNSRIKLHKWAYHFTKRSGFDGDNYLAWLQIQNRNTSDFVLLTGDPSQISREEAIFKAFLIQENTDERNGLVQNRNSSKEFYKFLFYIKDRV